MLNIIVLFVILLIFAMAIGKIISDKRKGIACVGCSLSDNCSKVSSTFKDNKTMQQINIKHIE
ncbi:FeoB-associated Cys-rich membrane protein [Psychromonas sp. CD1]|uniref:FeoB-associated Cys-rich membrane protein n=1 Tax=Psychromonas sp. CD1 TaxID=1979839 RepID=UPI000B9B9CCA|nr:FeoB-associated Cys-rich membrane protein [Psychromonas sp. CD1]